MRITITGGAGRLGQALAARWQATHQVRAVDTIPLPAGIPSQEHLVGDLRDPAFAEQAVTDAAAIVHLAPIAPADSDQRPRPARRCHPRHLSPAAGRCRGRRADGRAWRHPRPPRGLPRRLARHRAVGAPAGPHPGAPRALSGRVQCARAGSRAAPADNRSAPRRDRGRIRHRGAAVRWALAARGRCGASRRASRDRWEPHHVHYRPTRRWFARRSQSPRRATRRPAGGSTTSPQPDPARESR